MEMKEMIGLHNEKELLLLQELAGQVTDGVIVNIGTFQGKSTIYLASQAEVKTYTIDNSEYELFDSYAEQFGLQDKIEKIVSPSQEVDWKLPIGLLFIDGCHKYDSVLSDYKHYAPHIIKGGWLIFHDTLETEYTKWAVINVPKVLEDIDLKDYTLEIELENMKCLKRK